MLDIHIGHYIIQLHIFHTNKVKWSESKPNWFVVELQQYETLIECVKKTQTNKQEGYKDLNILKDFIFWTV